MTTTTGADERELSILFSVPSSVYTRLFLILNSADLDLYTPAEVIIKNIYANGRRTIQSPYGFAMEHKEIIFANFYTYVYRHTRTNLTLLLRIRDCLSRETIINSLYNDDDKETHNKYHQVIRDYIYCKDTGIRIAIERHYNDYLDPDVGQMDYDCFNRYRFSCYIHIESEMMTDIQLGTYKRLRLFLDRIANDELIYKLLFVMAQKNLNGISDEIININNMTLLHKYGYPKRKAASEDEKTTTGASIKTYHLKGIKYFSLKYDGIRKNFCIFNKYLHIDGRCYEFEHHWFGQVIIGHCELMECGRIIIIDIYMIEENFLAVAKRYNLSYTGALQNYHQYTTDSMASGAKETKSQDEYFHMKRLNNTIQYIKPLEAIDIINLLQSMVWSCEHNLSRSVELQKFYPSLRMTKQDVQPDTQYDGYLGYSFDKIYKIKVSLTIDLLFKFDEMYRHVMKRMKTKNQELKKLCYSRNVQKTLDWDVFEHKFPGKFEMFAREFVYFSGGVNFHQHYPDWTLSIDVGAFFQKLHHLCCTSFVLLVEFDVCARKKVLRFTRVRIDKHSANSMRVFRNILKQL